MAFIIAGAVRMGVKAVKDGMAAHRDAQNPEGISERSVEYDRWGNPKQRGPVYDLVMKAEGKGKGRAVGGANGERVAAQGGHDYVPQRRASTDKTGMHKGGGGEDYGPQDWDAKRRHEEAPPPTYHEAISPPLEQPRSGFGTLPPHLSHSSNAALPRAGLARPAQPAPPLRRSSSSSSSSSLSSSSSSSSEGHKAQYKGLGRKERKALRKANREQSKDQRRVEKAERKALRARQRADREAFKAEQRGARRGGASKSG